MMLNSTFIRIVPLLLVDSPYFKPVIDSAYHFDKVTVRWTLITSQCAKHLDGFQGLWIPLGDFAVKPRAHQAVADPNDADDGPARFARGGAWERIQLQLANSTVE